MEIASNGRGPRWSAGACHMSAAHQNASLTPWGWFRCWIPSDASGISNGSLYPEPHVRWSERTAVTPSPTQFDVCFGQSSDADYWLRDGQITFIFSSNFTLLTFGVSCFPDLAKLLTSHFKFCFSVVDY